MFIENKKKRRKSTSFDLKLPETSKQINYEKEQEKIYKNAFLVKSRPKSERVKSNDFLKKTQPDEHNSTYILKQTINKQQDQIVRLKTQVQYTSKELEKLSNENSFNDISTLHKLLLASKKKTEDLSQALLEKDQKIEEIKKNSKFFLVQELESENSCLLELCKKQTNELKKLSEELAKKDSQKNQEEEIQKSILLSQLKKEKERFSESLEEKNAEIIKWRERVLELEKNGKNFKKSLKKKWKIKEKEMTKEIEELKGQVEKGAKKLEKIEMRYESQIANLHLEYLNEKNLKRAKYSPDCVIRVKNLDPVPGILEFIQKKAAKLGCTTDSLFHQIVMSHTNSPTIENFQSFLEIPDDWKFLINEILDFLSQNKQILISVFTDFFHKVKFTPNTVQKIYRHLTKRLQVTKIQRNEIKRFFSKDLLKKTEDFQELLMREPFDLDSHQASSILSFLYPQGLERLKKSSVVSLFISRFPVFFVLNAETESICMSFLGNVIKNNFEDIFRYCKDVDKTNSLHVPVFGFIKCLEKFGLVMDGEMELFIEILCYKSSRKIKKVHYLGLFSMISPESSLDFIRDYYLNLIRCEVCKQGKPISAIFNMKNNEVSGEDFIEALEEIGIKGVPQTYLGLLTECFQVRDKQEVCLDYKKLSQYLIGN